MVNYNRIMSVWLQNTVWCEPWAWRLNFFPLFILDKVDQGLEVTISVVDSVLSVLDAVEIKF